MRRVLVVAAWVLGVLAVGLVVALVVAGPHSAPHSAPLSARPSAPVLPHTKSRSGVLNHQVQSAWVLPQPASYQGGIGVGYPDSVAGALSAANAMTAALYAASDEEGTVSRVLEATTTSDSTQVNAFAAELGVWASEEGAGASVGWAASWTPMGCRVVTSHPGSLVVAIEGTIAFPGATAGNQMVAWPERWVKGTWRSVATALPTPWKVEQPPGGGWQAC